MISPERIHRLLDKEEVEYTHTADGSGDHWLVEVRDVSCSIDLSRDGDYLLFRSPGLTKLPVEPSDSLLRSLLQPFAHVKKGGFVADAIHYAVAHRLPGRAGISHDLFVRALLEVSEGYARAVQAGFDEPVAAAC